MVSIIAFDKLSKEACQASNICVHLAGSTVMVFAVMTCLSSSSNVGATGVVTFSFRTFQFNLSHYLSEESR